MTATKVTDLKANMKHYLDKVLAGEVVIVTRPKNSNIVMVSEEEYNRLKRLEKLNKKGRYND